MSKLSVPMREAVRLIADGKSDEVPSATRTALVRRGIVHGDDLTDYGRHVHEKIMESGDGPEALKLRLTFGGRR